MTPRQRVKALFEGNHWDPRSDLVSIDIWHGDAKMKGRLSAVLRRLP